ncbi:arylsulfatase [Rubritalea spongiae]|uniref:Arylsulfatase n=1 Tax=Rubritalea spongiae TaxID=430797 RepID=A0ABW5E984_9BACT
MKILSILLSLTIGLQAASLEKSRPNIVFVLTDDQGMGDLSCMGNPILKTPNIDAFYEKSSRFTYFQVNPTCTPTRAAIMSGREPFAVGVSHTILSRERLALDVVTMPQALQTAGYKNGIFGKWHLGDEGEEYIPNNRGFDEVFIHGAGGLGQEQFGDLMGNANAKYFDNLILHNDTVVKTKGFCTDVFFQAALGWMKEQIEAKQPYFSYIALNAPHGPFYAPEENIKRFKDMGMDGKAAARYGMIENIDTNFGLLMQKLEEWNQLENTLVIFMTDNGMSMGSYKINGERRTPFNANMKGTKNSLWEGGTRVPSFWYLKGKTKEGSDIPALAADLDIYKTFCALTGAAIPESKLPPGGRSLLPLLENPDDGSKAWPNRTLFFNKGRWGSKGLTKEQAKYACAVRTQKWRLVHNKFLYDITNDLMQENDLAAQNPEVVKELQKKYEAWWKAVQAPLAINEGLETPKKGNYYLQRLQVKQLKENGEPPLWEPKAF